MRRKPKFLSREQEFDLAVKWRDTQDAQALDRIVDAHMPLVGAVSKNFSRFNLEQEDLLQEGVIGLMMAIKRFDPALGNRFSTFARWWIMAAMQDFAMRNYSMVRGPTSSKGKSDFYAGKRNRHLSLEAPIGTDESSSTLGDVIESEDPRPDEVVERIIDVERRYAELQRVIGKLKPRSQDVIMRRFGEDEQSLEEIGKIYGIGKERVRQIEARAIQDIHAVMRAKKKRR